ncbi:MAG: threonine-phosphate decarboxylase [Rhodocyclaceae bacterium]|nr:threonine-phosphate decarboxylase [Rhodocyclaceae bacterium]
MLEHGGRLREAAQRYRIALGDWLDLSTGINPTGYPVPPVPLQAWLRLPEDGDGLEAAAARYYGTDRLLPVAGTQAAILALPACLDARRVLVPEPTYVEHPHAWRERELRRCHHDEIDAQLDDADLVVVAHPDNPTGTRHPRPVLLDWAHRLARRGGWLIVDEAFIDPTPTDSLTDATGIPGLIVLRSLGKFFGLAGARVGFVFGPEALLAALRERLGPWTLGGPARHVARIALADQAWQEAMRARLAHDGARLAALLEAYGLGKPTGTPLFQWLPTPRAAEFQDRLARQGILVRRFDQPSSLRFGLPAEEAAWRRLDAALAGLQEP